MFGLPLECERACRGYKSTRTGYNCVEMWQDGHEHSAQSSWLHLRKTVRRGLICADKYWTLNVGLVLAATTPRYSILYPSRTASAYDDCAKALQSASVAIMLFPECTGTFLFGTPATVLQVAGRHEPTVGHNCHSSGRTSISPPNCVLVHMPPCHGVLHFWDGLA